MAKPRKLPVVAICGRPNVGKSTLFNRIVGRQSAIVHKEEGVTRDRFYATAEWNGCPFEVADTGGIVEHPTDPITHKIQQQIRTALEEAHLILFVLDGQQDVTRVDQEIRDDLFKLGKPVVVAVNKLDNDELAKNAVDFYALGFSDLYPISSGHGLGIADLLDAVTAHLPTPLGLETPAAADAATKVAVIGRPNVGKSSFINAILNEERTIVTEVPGTTRDAIDIEFRRGDRDYLFIDTPGLRRKRGIKKDLERFSVARSLRSIRRADVCLVLVDAVEGLTDQDKRIMDYVARQGAAMALVWTKWDLIEDKKARINALRDELDLKAPFLKYVPHLTISNTTRLRLLNTFEYIDRVAQAARFRVSTGELNRFIAEVQAKGPPATRKGRSGKIFYAVQAGVKPTTFVLFVNQKELFHFSYVRHIENRLREKYGFEGVPITLNLRERKQKPS